MDKFQKQIYSHYAAYARDLPWRRTRDPYRIVVSEIMLQQTQVKRVIEKYEAFICAFPTWQSLAKASLYEIMRLWQGLGYNRRALALKKLGERIVSEFKGVTPSDRNILITLPGIGQATSGSICAFAFNKPEVFVETNIRSVFLHYFFKNAPEISDTQLLPYIAKALDRKNPRTWYSALMDYGVYLKEHRGNPGRRSLHYKKQSPFQGSQRQRRGEILKVVVKEKQISQAKLYRLVRQDKAQVKAVLAALASEGFLKKKGTVWSIEGIPAE